MEKIITYKLTEEDFRLLSKEIPKNPCVTMCPFNKATCCGCSERDDYDKAIKPFEDAGLVEIAGKINRLRELSAEIRELKEEFANLAGEIPPEIRNRKDISFGEVNTNDT